MSRMFLAIFLLASIASSFSQTIKNKNSLLITDPTVLNALNSDLDLAFQLGLVSNFLASERARLKLPNPAITPGDFFQHPFTQAHKEQVDHSLLPPQLRLGGEPLQDRMMNKIFRDWKSANDLKKITNANQLKGSPFRLLAVANLMDQAGFFDDRGLPPITLNPRSLGEIHLVYGYVDEAYENTNKSPFPQTFVLTYRLPRLNQDGSVDNILTYESLIQPENKLIWQNQMKQWAKLWIDLSSHGLKSAEFLAKLRNILSLSVRPNNFLNMRSNTKINDKEFEIREWYIVEMKSLIPRKPKNEPYRCLDDSDFLASLINYYWDDSVRDLDRKTRAPLDEKGFLPTKTGRNGYFVFRQLGDLDEHNASFLRSGKKPISTDVSTCKVGDNYPFEMAAKADEKFGDGTIRPVAPFARYTSDFAWKVPKVYNNRRHQFAMRTCSGCHSKEGAAAGFHIENRLSTQESKLSPFLTGTGNNTFTYQGKTFTYNELQKRSEWLRKSFNKQAVLYESLNRNDGN
jgi:hypothetical protein